MFHPLLPQRLPHRLPHRLPPRPLPRHSLAGWSNFCEAAMIRRLLLSLVLLPLLAACQPLDPDRGNGDGMDAEFAAAMLEPEGFIQQIHDPVIAHEQDRYYVFSTGSRMPIICSQDMLVWEFCGRVFQRNPAWFREVNPDLPDIWAPDISFSMTVGISTTLSQPSARRSPPSVWPPTKRWIRQVPTMNGSIRVRCCDHGRVIPGMRLTPIWSSIVRANRGWPVAVFGVALGWHASILLPACSSTTSLHISNSPTDQRAPMQHRPSKRHSSCCAMDTGISSSRSISAARASTAPTMYGLGAAIN